MVRFFKLFSLSFLLYFSLLLSSSFSYASPALGIKKEEISILKPLTNSDGRWLLIIQVPATYPLEPPSIRFATPVVHPNVHLETGEICLDLLRKDQGWSGTYTVAECVKAVRMLLGMPEVDSPLNVDVAALLRNGDTLAARGLVELWCREQRFDGP